MSTIIFISFNFLGGTRLLIENKYGTITLRKCKTWSQQCKKKEALASVFQRFFILCLVSIQSKEINEDFCWEGEVFLAWGISKGGYKMQYNMRVIIKGSPCVFGLWTLLQCYITHAAPQINAFLLPTTPNIKIISSLHAFLLCFSLLASLSLSHVHAHLPVAQDPCCS